jgi:sugar/nucleoside kinase (ribokinase family)
MVDVVTIGSATLDVFFQSSEFQVTEKDGTKLLTEKLNEKIDVEKNAVATGGAGTNVAVGLARLGLSVACIAEIGDDFAGQMILQDLQKEGVNTDWIVKVSGEETANAALLIGEDGSRTALVHRGASRMLTVEDIAWDKLETKWIHLSSVENLELIQKVLSFCKEKSIKLSWNPGNWEIEQIANGSLKPDWSAVEVLLCNREELAKLSGTNLADESVWKSDWCFAGPHIVITTDGKNGGRYCVDGGVNWYESAQSEVVQETGAGDAFAVGIIAGTLMNKNIEQSIEIGKMNGASVVRHFGAKTGLLHTQDLPA